MRLNKDQMNVPAGGPVDPYADPVCYLRGFGIEAELVETREADLPSAA